MSGPEFALLLMAPAAGLAIAGVMLWLVRRRHPRPGE